MGAPGHQGARVDFVYMSAPLHPCYHLHPLNTPFHGGCATINAGCQRMAIGLDEHLPRELVIYVSTMRGIIFGVSTMQTSSTNRVAALPSLGPRGIFLIPAV